MQKGRWIAIVVESIMILLGLFVIVPFIGFPVGDTWNRWSFSIAPLWYTIFCGIGILILLYLYGKKQISTKWRYWIVFDYILAVIPIGFYFLIFSIFDLFGVV